MIALDQVTGIVVTRGDVDLNPVLFSLPFSEVVVWDNGARTVTRYGGGEPLDREPDDDRAESLGVYGRYAAISYATRPVIAVQDDDCVLDDGSWAELLASYEPGYVTCNMPEAFRQQSMYALGDHGLVGFGAIFDRDLPAAAFARFTRGLTRIRKKNDDLYRRRSDVVFTALTPIRFVDVPYTNLPWATAANRMYRQRTHTSDRRRTLALARSVRGIG